MLKYYPYGEAARQLFAGSSQALDEAILFGDLACRMKLSGELLSISPVDADLNSPTSIQSELPKWERKPFSGWFKIPFNSAERIVMRGFDTVVCVLSKKKDHGSSRWAFFVGKNFGELELSPHALFKASLFIGQSDFDSWKLRKADQDAAQSNPTLQRDGLGTRERTTLLRIIHALSVMAKLPDRGATSAVELQLQSLGYKGPSDDTIRVVLREARQLPMQ